jgi:hypothetical protein
MEIPYRAETLTNKGRYPMKLRLALAAASLIATGVWVVVGQPWAAALMAVSTAAWAVAALFAWLRSR